MPASSTTVPSNPAQPQRLDVYLGLLNSAAAPATPITSGQVVVTQVTLTNSTASPTVRVSGGALTLQDDEIDSNGASLECLAVTGGSVDLDGRPSGQEHSFATATGLLIDNTGSNAVSALGDTFEVNRDAIDATKLTGDFRIAGEQAINAVPAGYVINVQAGGRYDAYTVGSKPLTVAFQNGPTLSLQQGFLQGTTTLSVTGTWVPGATTSPWMEGRSPAQWGTRSRKSTWLSMARPGPASRCRLRVIVAHGGGGPGPHQGLWPHHPVSHPVRRRCGWTCARRRRPHGGGGRRQRHAPGGQCHGAERAHRRRRAEPIWMATARPGASSSAGPRTTTGMWPLDAILQEMELSSPYSIRVEDLLGALGRSERLVPARSVHHHQQRQRQPPRWGQRRQGFVLRRPPRRP